jgi:hypothetical protein
MLMPQLWISHIFGSLQGAAEGPSQPQPFYTLGTTNPGPAYHPVQARLSKGRHYYL